MKKEMNYVKPSCEVLTMDMETVVMMGGGSAGVYPGGGGGGSVIVEDLFEDPD